MNDRNRLRTLGPSPASPSPPPPLSFFFFFSFLFVSYSDLSASSIPGPVLPPRHIVPRCMHAKSTVSSRLPAPHRSLPPPASLTAACLSLNFTLSPSWSWQVVDSIMHLAPQPCRFFATEPAVNRDHVPFSKGKSISYAKLCVSIKVWRIFGKKFDYIFDSWCSDV